MPKVTVERVVDPAVSIPHVFEEMARRSGEIQRRAFELFLQRGCESGREVEDWVNAEKQLTGFSPAAELTEMDGEYALQMTLPGLSAADVQVTALPHELIVRAGARQERLSRGASVVWSEFGHGDIVRRIDLPEAIETESATANLEDGMLRIAAKKVKRETFMQTAVA